MIECTLEDLYEFNNLTNYVNLCKFKTKTRHGYKTIRGVDITAKNSIQHKLILSSGKSIISSPDHLFFYKDWVKAKEFKAGDYIETEDGLESIIGNIILHDTADLYDIEVDEVHEFYANGIVSHNSTLAKVITYMCYGRVDGANLKDLPNRVNGNLWGKISLDSKGNQIDIERGVSPGIFKVSINGTEYDVAGKTNLQEFLETEIYEIPYHVFKNVIILSVNDFKSFITMSPYDKKQIIDRIFGFTVINEMRELVKSKRKIIIDEIRTFEDEIRTLDESIQSVLSKIKQYENATKEKDASKIIELKEKLIKLNEARKKLKEANDKTKTKIDDNDKTYRAKAKKESEILTEINSIKKGLALYENNTCPTCNSPLDSEFHQDIKSEKEEALIVLRSKYTEIQNEVIDIDVKLSELREQGKQIHIKVGQLETQMSSFKSELIKLTESDDDSSNHFKELIEEFNTRKDVKGEIKLKSEGEDYYLSILETLMGDDGIKNLAVRSILPSFNNNILLMGKEMGIPFGIKFDDKFNCTIHHLGQEVSPKTLSTGERKKIDFVIIMALIKMIKIRFSSLNILFLDEIFSSIDSDGVYHIINILHETIQDIGLNTFVINHTVLPSEYFDKKLEITKDAGFSEFTIETIR
jgi:DNA repair exonuclease SbcCD ATPase subunit